METSDFSGYDSFDTWNNYYGAEESSISCYEPYTPGKGDSVLKTNLPIFDYDDKESVQNYIDNGDISGAQNVGDLPLTKDDSIELPRELKVTGGYAQGISNAYSLDKDCIFNWKQTVDTMDYLYDIQSRLSIGTTTKSGSSVLTGNYYYSGWETVCNSYHYDGATEVSRTIRSEFLNDSLLEGCFSDYVSKTQKKIGYKSYLIHTLEIRVRNRVGNSVSDWVVIKIDLDSVSTTATVQDDNGNIQDNDEYNGNDVSDKINSEDVDLSHLTSLLEYIRNGFGLLGKNGLLAMIRDFFSFLPKSIFIMLEMTIAILCIVTVIKWIAKE